MSECVTAGFKYTACLQDAIARDVSGKELCETTGGAFPIPETRNLKPETRDLNPKTRIPKPESRIPNPEPREPETAYPNTDTQNCVPESEVQIPKPEARNCMPETRIPNPESQIPRHESRDMNLELRITTPKTRDSMPESQVRNLKLLEWTNEKVATLNGMMNPNSSIPNAEVLQVLRSLQ